MVIQWAPFGFVAILQGILFYVLLLPKSKNTAVLMLKDFSSLPDKERPFSFARTQLLFWTLIIMNCTTIAYGQTGNDLSHMLTNPEVLILLGISIGTTTAGRMIDNTQENNASIVRHQNTQKSISFFVDILSDEKGMSLHRFQALIFNLTFGIVFVVSFADSGGREIPVLGTNALALIGISSAGYIALKANENQIVNKLKSQSTKAIESGATLNDEEEIPNEDGPDHQPVG